VGADKRQHERYRVAIDVTFRHGDALVTARTRDISLGGMFLETTQGVPYGTQLTIELKLPALQAPAVLEGTVRWMGPDGMGIQFGALRARETWAINQLVRR
jgi:uncharacterized protein (TIGR02266 family)